MFSFYQRKKNSHINELAAKTIAQSAAKPGTRSTSVDDCDAVHAHVTIEPVVIIFLSSNQRLWHMQFFAWHTVG